jgi:hypothetical protein
LLGRRSFIFKVDLLARAVYSQVRESLGSSDFVLSVCCGSSQTSRPDSWKYDPVFGKGHGNCLIKLLILPLERKKLRTGYSPVVEHYLACTGPRVQSPVL